MRIVPPALRKRAVRTALLACGLALIGCAHEVIPLDREPIPPMIPPARPLGITLGLSIQRFEAKRLAEAALADRLARQLRDSQLFVGIIHPVPEDFDPLWKIRISVRDELEDPNSNLWKSALATAILPLRLILYQEEGYTLNLEAEILRRDAVIGSYEASAKVRHRFQAYDPRKELQAAELLVDRATAEILSAISRDLKRIDQEDRARAGT